MFVLQIDKLSQFSILRKCRTKFDCLIFEILFIKELKPGLNTQKDSVRAKLFTWHCVQIFLAFNSVSFKSLRISFVHLHSNNVFLFILTWKWRWVNVETSSLFRVSTVFRVFNRDGFNFCLIAMFYSLIIDKAYCLMFAHKPFVLYIQSYNLQGIIVVANLPECKLSCWEIFDSSNYANSNKCENEIPNLQTFEEDKKVLPET